MNEVLYGKKCPKCKHVNDNLAMKCVACKEGLSRIKPQNHKVSKEEKATASSSENKKRLDQESSAEECRYTAKMSTAIAKIYPESNPALTLEIKDGDTIGREGDINMSSLPRSEFISRKHATFILQKGKWFLRAESKTNPTLVNLKLIGPGEITELSDGDKIIVADTAFIFRSL